MRIRKFLIETSTLMFNISNLALYIDSPNSFLEHYCLSGNTCHYDHRFTEGSTGERIAFWIPITLFSFGLAISNQKAYRKTIDKLQKHPVYPDPDESTTPARWETGLEVFSGFGKAIITSSSLLALSKTLFGTAAGLTIAIICTPGNFAAQYAILNAPFRTEARWKNSYRTANLIAHLFTFFYNLANTALYFNAGDAFLKNIGELDHRLTSCLREESAHTCSGDFEVGLVTLLGFFSVVLLASTQRAYSSKIRRIFTDETADENTNCHTLFQIDAVISSFYKALITGLSLTVVMNAITQSIPASGIIAGALFAGNWIAQYSVFRPKPRQGGDDQQTIFCCPRPDNGQYAQLQ